MSTYTFTGFKIQYDIAGDPVAFLGASTLSLGYNSGTTPTFSYSVTTGPTATDLPVVQVTSDNSVDMIVDGNSMNTLPIFDDLADEVLLGEINWDDNGTPRTTLVMVLHDDQTSTDYIYVIGGDALPTIASLANFTDFLNNNLTGIQTATGPNAPGQVIDLSTSPFATSSDIDVFNGTVAAEVFSTGIGDDFITAAGGDDSLDGGADNDWLDGGDGNDTIFGGSGDDQMLGRTGNDLLYGDDGNDNIAASDGNDTVYGGNGDDSLGGGNGIDLLFGDAGNDIIGSGNDNDTIDAGDGHDAASGGYGADSVVGGLGNDTLAGSFGHDVVDGGDGNDSLGGGFGRDTINGGAGDDSVGAGDDDDLVFGDDGNDFLAGGNGNDILWGGLGNDTLNGGAGADTMMGGDGVDSLRGLAGNDVFVFLTAAEVGIGVGTRDFINDFTLNEDLIDFTAMGITGNNLSFGSSFSGTAGEMIATFGGGNAVIHGDIDGDGTADFQLLLLGVGTVSNVMFV